jgi:uncharacterized protein (DUF2236 family)
MAPARAAGGADVTAEPYAGATDLVARSAAAYVTGVPQAPADDGLFGPGSVTWRVSGRLESPVASLRALLLQALHPLAMAGVDQHSSWRQDPVGRLAATSAYLATVTFGERAAAERVAARVRRIHERVHGTDPVTGLPYAASDPALLLWIHVALVDSSLAVGRLFGAPLSPEDAGTYVAEMAVAAELVGVPRALVPVSMCELENHIAAALPSLRCTPAARESMAYLLDPPGLDDDVAAIWEDIRCAALAALPAWAVDAYGYTAPGPLTPGRLLEIRQALGVLDAAFLAEPGVLEARQRIALRMRAKRRA